MRRLRTPFTFEGTEWTNAPVFENACGCTDSTAFNYDDGAEYDDGSCIAVVEGCMDMEACNFNALANTEDGSCTYAESGYDCDGMCLNDADGDGVCDEFEVAGCTDDAALNFDADATDDDGSCVYCTLTATLDIEHVSCAEAQDGQIAVAAEGAFPDSSAMTYTLLPNGIAQADSVFAGLPGGFYEVIVADESGCADTLQAEVAEPDPLLVLLDEVVGSVPEQAEGSIAITVSGGTAPYEFSWLQLDGVFTSGEEDVTGLNPGTYQVTVTDANGCSTTSFEITVESIVGIGETDALLALSVYPNPTSDQFYLAPPSGTGTMTVRLFTLEGRMVWNDEYANPPESVVIPVHDLANGQYVVHVSMEQKQWFEKVQVFR